MTASQLQRKYIKTKKMGSKWNTYLQIGDQGFSIVEQTTKKRAQWFGKMLSLALARMLLADHIETRK